MAFALDAFRLAGRTALVTGAASGLGRVFAEALAAVGARVHLTDVEAEGCAGTRASIIAAGGSAEVHVLDVTDEAGVAGLARTLAEDGTAPDILVNNAGVASACRRLHEIPVAEWDRVLDVNLRGTFLCTRALLPAMIARKRGSIINLASIAGLNGIAPELSAVAANYSASKGAIIALTRQVAVEYGPDGIRCNAIAPGWHLGTRLGRYALPPDEAKRQAIAVALERGAPLGRTGDPAELAGLLVYLASDASSFVTGQVIAHDGGWTAW
jgi:NAD(P)-dependent dehydrogenase (short-subunit alcohol dehydrogenase family)